MNGGLWKWRLKGGVFSGREGGLGILDSTGAGILIECVARGGGTARLRKLGAGRSRLLDGDEKMDAAVRLGPFAVLAQAGISADSLDDAGGSGHGLLGALDDVLERHAHISRAAGEEIQSGSVAINGTAGDFEFEGGFMGAAPR